VGKDLEAVPLTRIDAEEASRATRLRWLDTAPTLLPIAMDVFFGL